MNKARSGEKEMRSGKNQKAGGLGKSTYGRGFADWRTYWWGTAAKKQWNQQTDGKKKDKKREIKFLSARNRAGAI